MSALVCAHSLLCLGDSLCVARAENRVTGAQASLDIIATDLELIISYVRGLFEVSNEGKHFAHAHKPYLFILASHTPRAESQNILRSV